MAAFWLLLVQSLLGQIGEIRCRGCFFSNSNHVRLKSCHLQLFALDKLDIMPRPEATYKKQGSSEDRKRGFQVGPKHAGRDAYLGKGVLWNDQADEQPRRSRLI
jgi:hypothetical protein